ncbi:MAG TPA: YceI family protein [Acidimicrobiia bacterium]
MTTEATSRTKTPLAGKYVLDPAHSNLQISARHLMVSKVTGTFGEIQGTIEVGENPEESLVEVIAQSASITTGTKDRDVHLRSADFLDVEQYPTVNFKSTAVASDGENWKLTGDLTIREITNPVTFDLEYEGSVVDPYGNQKAVFTADGQIDRESWGLTWNVPLEGGGVLVSKQFKITFAIQAVLQA